MSAAPPAVLGTTRSSPRGRRPTRSAAWLVVPLSLALATAYVLVYPIRGFRLSLGSDTPFYAWWSRLAASEGFSARLAGERPVTTGVVAALADLTGIPVGALLAPLAPVLGVALALATAALAEVALGRDRTRFALTALFTAAFLSLLVPGYVATLVFGAAFVGALACLLAGLARGDASGGPAGSGRRSAVAAAFLIAAAGLAHPLFLVLGGVVLGGGALALLPETRAQIRRGVRPLATPAARFLAPVVAGAAAAAGVFLALGPGPRVKADISRDAILRRLQLGELVAQSFRRVFQRTVPWWRALVVAGLAALPFLPRLGGVPLPRSDRARAFWGTVATWSAVTVAGAVLLLAGTLAPGQRLAAFCLPIPVLAALGARRLQRSAGGGRAGAVRAVAASALFVGVTGMFWLKQQPLVTGPAVREYRAAAAALAVQPPDTPLIFLVNESTDKLGFVVARRLNYLRAAVPPDRVEDVYAFVGTAAGILNEQPTLTGEVEHDRMALDTWRRVEPLLHGSPTPLVVILRNTDFATYAAAFLTPHFDRPLDTFQLADGVIAVPGLAGSAPFALARASATDPGPNPGVDPMSPWLPVWSAPLLLAVLWMLGWPWTRAALPRLGAVATLGLAPAFGTAALGLAALGVDAAGLRVADGGGVVAAGVVAASGLGVLRAVRTRPPGRLPGQVEEAEEAA